MGKKKKNKDLKKIKKHQRVNDILLGPIERASIKWLVERMPHWVNSDILTFLGFIGSILVGFSYYMTNSSPKYLWLASLGFFINWFGDSLDGNLARYRKVERPRYGFFIDHTIDTISEVIIFISIGTSPYVDLTLALIALAGYQCMANLVFITTSVKGEFKISYGKLGPTEVRVIAMIANTIIFYIGNPKLSLPFSLPFISEPYYLYNLIIYFATYLLFFFFFYTTITQAVELEHKDRKKWLKKVRKNNEAQEKL